MRLAPMASRRRVAVQWNWSNPCCKTREEPEMFYNDRLVEIFQRSRGGQYMKEVDYDLLLARRTQELVKEYNITFDPNIVCPADDAMADRVFEAGLQLFT